MYKNICQAWPSSWQVLTKGTTKCILCAVPTALNSNSFHCTSAVSFLNWSVRLVKRTWWEIFQRQPKLCVFSWLVNMNKHVPHLGKLRTRANKTLMFLSLGFETLPGTTSSNITHVSTELMFITLYLQIFTMRHRVKPFRKYRWTVFKYS